MRYNIELTFTTGNSLSISQEIENFPFTWDDYNIVKQAYESIIEHYKAIKAKEIYKYTDKFWYSEEFPEDNIIIPLDKYNSKRFNCFWIDYFGKLEKVEVKIETLSHTF